jgi:hypothetical protein
MSLDEGQRNKVQEWISAGLKLSEIQNRLASELGVKMTYMEVRLLVDDLKLVPKDPEPPKPAPGPTPAATPEPEPAQAAPAPQPVPGGVSVSVDQLARTGAVVSGKVTFSDGVKGEWYFDQTGRLALSSSQPGYRPSQPDLQKFQTALDAELSKMGF